MPSIFLKSNTSVTATTGALILPEPAVIIKFRPGGDYKGKGYGFDWIRDKDFKDSFSYSEITTQYDALIRMYPDSDGDLLKISNMGDAAYPIPVLSLRADYEASVKLDLKVEVKQAPQKIELRYDSSLLEVNKDEIEDCSLGIRELDNYLEVKCLCEFDEDQFIEVYSDDKLAGALRVVANDIKHRYHLKVLVVNVATKLNARVRTGSLDTTESAIMDRTLNHFLSTTESIDVDLKLSSPPHRAKILADFSMEDAGDNVMQYTNALMPYLDAQLRKKILDSTEIKTKYPELLATYDNYHKIFVFDEPGKAMVTDETGSLVKFGIGGVMPIGTATGAMFNGRKDTTYPHELMHGLGLHHTFGASSPILFAKGKTDNIMDYSTLRWSTSYIQWLKAWQLHDQKRANDERPRLFRQDEDEST